MKPKYIQRLYIDHHLIQDDYINNIPCIKNLNNFTFDNNITIFCGENGSGKSTLLEAIALAFGFPAEGGTLNYRFSTYDSHSNLYHALHLVKGYEKCKHAYFLRAESFYNVATIEMEYVDALHPSKRYHEKSHGESFLAVLQDHLNENGLYILDEPEAALSLQNQLALLSMIHRYAKKGAQFIIATHSLILQGIPNASLYEFEKDIHPISFEDSKTYEISSLMIHHRDHLFYHLFVEEEES